MMGIDKDTRISLYCAPLWAALLGISYAVLKARNPENKAFAKN